MHETGRHLQQISVELIQAFNDRDYGNAVLKQYMDPKFKCSSGSQPAARASSLRDHIENMRSRAMEEPSHSFEVVSSCVGIDEATLKVAVWLTCRVVGGFSDGIQRDGVSRLDWRKRNGRWMCVKHVGMMGSAMLSSF
ncbi:hypothetical protein LTR10_007711 [Elasticomyces elasticus]|nr:hypothetical protein LTR10_007711 [Elasticomyces elasticus]